MSKKKSQCQVLYYEVEFVRMAQSEIIEPMSALQHVLEIKHALDNNLLTESERGSLRIYLSDIKIDNEKDIAYFLFNKNDSDAVDPTRKNLTTGEVRTFEKEDEDDNIDNAIHVLLDLKPCRSPGAQKRYLFIVERETGLSISVIKGFFNKSLNICSKEYHEGYLVEDHSGAVDNNGDTLMVSSRSYFEYEGFMSKSLQNDLENGCVHDFLLVDTEMNEKNMEDSGLEATVRQLKLKPKRSQSAIKNPTKTGGLEIKGNFQLLKSAYEIAKGREYSELRVRFTRQLSDSPECISFETDTDEVDIHHARYVRKKTISDFSKDLESSYSQLDNEMMDKMTDLCYIERRRQE